MEELEWHGYPTVKNVCCFDTTPAYDRQTHRQADKHLSPRALCIRIAR